jgi:hypothetical protein
MEETVVRNVILSINNYSMSFIGKFADVIPV